MAGLATGTFAQESPDSKPRPETGIPTPTFNLVLASEGCGVWNGSCTDVPYGTGTDGSYGDNQAGPLTLLYFTATGASSVSYQQSLQLPQTGSGANLPVSGEYGSQSEATLQLDGTGRYLTIMGYGVSANAFNGDPTLYGEPGGELAQSGSLTGQSYTPVPRVVATIDPNGNVNSSTASFNVFNQNNPRSVASADGFNFYISGQGGDSDATGGVFLTTFGDVNDAPTTITGDDGGTSPPDSQDTRTVQIYPASGSTETLYVSMDSKEGSYNRSFVGELGNPPATTVFNCTGVAGGCGSGNPNPGPAMLNGFGNAGGTGRVKLSAAETNGIVASGTYINLSPENYFFASPTVLYVADSGYPKNTSADNETTYSLCGAGGLQKWVNVSGTWTWEYTLYQGLGLVKNGNTHSTDPACSSDTDGTTGLYGLAGKVVGSTVYLFATNYTINDLDPSYLYGITDVLSATTNPGGETFTQLAAAPTYSDFKGVSLAPTLPSTSTTYTSSPSGLALTVSGTGCEPGTYATPFTLVGASSGDVCQVSAATPQAGTTGVEYVFGSWSGVSTGSSNPISYTVAGSPASLNASFGSEYELTTAATTGGTVSAGGYYASGSVVPITATPSTGYYFVNFTGATTSTSNPLSFTTGGAPETITANFAPMINPQVTVSPNATAIVYGQALSASTLSGGVELDETNNVPVAGTFTFTHPTLIPPGAGAFLEKVTFTPTNTAEYYPSSASALVTVNSAPLTVTVDPASFTYGGALPTFTGSAATLVNGDTVGTTIGLTYSTTVLSNANAGTYTGAITASVGGSSAGNYSVTVDPGTLTITPATLTATCGSGSFVQFGVIPAFPITITGIVLPVTNPGPAVVHPDRPTGITSTCGVAPGITSSSAPGYYPGDIVPTVAGIPLANYTVVPVDGDLTIDSAAIVARPVKKK
jgi:hypothetical protein